MSDRSEKSLSTQLREHMDRLGWEYRAEVRMLCWTHSARDRADTLRIDYVVELDGRLLGIEVKAPPDKAADLGRDLLQCAQYAAGVIAANAHVPQPWIGRPLTAVFLRTKASCVTQRVLNHFEAAHRLYGPANVGFVVVDKWGISLRLCAERYWCEDFGFHAGLTDKASRIGNSTVRVA